MLSGVIVSIAIVTKLIAWSSFNDISKKQDQINNRIGMISRGEVGLIVAGVEEEIQSSTNLMW